MILDIDVAAQAMRWVSVTTTSRGAAAVSDPVVDSFTGDELATRIFGSGYLTGASAIPPASALAIRGAVVVNSSGRVGITVGSGKVVEPCGRAYALTTTNSTWWTKAWLPLSMVKTLGLTRSLAETTPVPFVTPLPMNLSSGSNVCRVDTAPSAVGAYPMGSTGTATVVTVTRTAGIAITAVAASVTTVTRVATGAATGAASRPVVAARVVAGGSARGAAIVITGAVYATGQVAISRATTSLPVVSTAIAGGSGNKPVSAALPASAAISSGSGVVGRRGWGGTGVTVSLSCSGSTA